jgi:carboxylate-amine ligase
MADLVAEDADALGCRGEMERIREIARNGTSAQRQRAAHKQATDTGAAPEDALKAVVDHLIEETAKRP